MSFTSTIKENAHFSKPEKCENVSYLVISDSLRLHGLTVVH